MSGPTSGAASEVEADVHRSTCQADQVLFDNNALRQMSVRKSNGVGNLKTDMMFGESLGVANGTIISANGARLEMSVCGMRADEHRERIADVACGKEGCLARGLLVEIGGNVVRGCNDQIGIRITNETETNRTTCLKAKTDVERVSFEEEWPTPFFPIRRQRTMRNRPMAWW